MNHISDLSEECMIQVFQNLEQEVIKICAEVCPSWNEFISNSVRTMRRFRAKANAFELGPKPIYRRKYSHMSSCQFFCHHPAESLDMLEFNRAHLKSAEFRYETFDLKQLMDALGHMPNLESFKLKNCRLSWDEHDVEIPVMPSLRHLSFCGELIYLKYFTKTKLTSLCVEELKLSDVDLLNELIDTQPTLKSLEVNIIPQPNPDSTKFLSFLVGESFPCLKKLSIKSKKYFNFASRIECQVLCFLMALSKTLEELEFHCEAPQFVLSVILEQMPALKKVGFVVDCLPTLDPSFFETLAPSEGIKELSLVLCAFEANSKPFLKCFPHIESLRTVVVDCAMAIGDHFTAINKKSLLEMRPDLTVKLSHLKCLYYEHIDGVWHLDVMPEIYPNLEMISLSELFFPHIAEKVAEQLTNFRALKHIKIRGGRRTMARFYHSVNKVDLRKIHSTEIVVTNTDNDAEKVFHIKMTATGFLEPCDYLSSTTK